MVSHSSEVLVSKGFKAAESNHSFFANGAGIEPLPSPFPRSIHNVRIRGHVPLYQREATNKYVVHHERYAKDHGEGETKLRIDQVLGDGTYKVRKGERAKEGGESVGQRIHREEVEKGRVCWTKNTLRMN